jgi:hypothetical protein
VRLSSVSLPWSGLATRVPCPALGPVTFGRWSSQADTAPTVRAADLPGRMRPRPLMAAGGITGGAAKPRLDELDRRVDR